MISVGGRDMNYFPGCTKGSADAQKDPQMHERIRECTKGSADARKDPFGVPPSCKPLNNCLTDKMCLIE